MVPTSVYSTISEDTGRLKFVVTCPDHGDLLSRGVAYDAEMEAVAHELEYHL
jgi:hypothetical protein